jgi:hypothetical protein
MHKPQQKVVWNKLIIKGIIYGLVKIPLSRN